MASPIPTTGGAEATTGDGSEIDLAAMHMEACPLLGSGRSRCAHGGMLVIGSYGGGQRHVRGSGRPDSPSVAVINGTNGGVPVLISATTGGSVAEAYGRLAGDRGVRMIGVDGSPTRMMRRTTV